MKYHLLYGIPRVRQPCAVDPSDTVDSTFLINPNMSPGSYLSKTGFLAEESIEHLQRDKEWTDGQTIRSVKRRHARLIWSANIHRDQFHSLRDIDGLLWQDKVAKRSTNDQEKNITESNDYISEKRSKNSITSHHCV